MFLFNVFGIMCKNSPGGPPPPYIAATLMQPCVFFHLQLSLAENDMAEIPF